MANKDVRYEVRRVYVCPKCGGDGWIYNDKWGDVPASVLQDRALFARYWRERGYDKAPPEEVECPDCGGTGVVYEWVPLEEALDALSKEGHKQEE